MFGYIRPYKPELLVKEYDVYKGVYCGLCKHLGKDFGILSRMTLSYDCTFLVMIALALKEQCPGFVKGKCVVNPLKKCNYCIGGDEEFALVGAVSVVMTYYKVIDDIKDSGFWGKVRAYCLLPFVTHSYKKAKKSHPKIDAIFVHYMQSQAETEKDPTAGIDAAAEPTAQMLSKVFMLLSQSEEQKIILNQLGYFIGRWIYLMDAADDIDKDMGNGSFNPFVKRLMIQQEEPIKKKELHEYCNSVLNQTLSPAIAAYNLLKFYQYGTNIKNTLM